MKIRNVFMLMAAFALASCSKSEMEETVVTGSDEIMLRSSVVDVATSRLAYEGTDLTKNPLTAFVPASLTTKDYKTLRCSGTMTFAGTDAVAYNKPVTSGDYKYPDAITNIYLSGLYPATGWTISTVDGSAGFTIKGKEDVMFATEKSTNLNFVNSATPTYANLAFEHQLTLLKVFVWGNDKAVDEEGITVNEIKLVKVNGAAISDSVSVALSAATQTVSFVKKATAVDSLACFKKGADDAFKAQTYTLTKDEAKEVAYVIAPPVEAPADKNHEYTLNVTYTDKNSKKRSMDVNIDLRKVNETDAFTDPTKGYAFNIKLKFIGNQIVATATVTDWKPGGTINQEI